MTYYTVTMFEILDSLVGKDLTRKEICKVTGLPRTTVFDNLRKLKAKGEVDWYQEFLENQGVGRPKVRWYIT